MIRFTRFILIYFILSALIIVPGIFSLVRYGLKPAIDFTGGTLIEYDFSKRTNAPAPADLQKLITDQQVDLNAISQTGNQSYLIRVKTITPEEHQKLLTALKDKFPEIVETRYETVGPVLGKELLQKTSIAAIMAILVILSYVAWAFRNVRYGVAAIIALIHDLLVVTSIFSFLGHFKGVEVDALFMTAILTTMSFSVHDTIVVFDRIRELERKISGVPFAQIMDRALNETMVRSLNNSLTIVFMLLALFLLGGDTIKWFVLALLIGTVSGTYSSPFIAAPVLYIWHKLRDRKK